MDLTQDMERKAETRDWHVHGADRRTDSPTASLVPPRRASLHRLLTGSGLETRYQPIVTMATRQPFAIEALVRLKLSRHVTLFPGDFLPQVEAAGLADVLTDAVANRAFDDWCAYADPMRPRRIPVKTLSINFALDVFLSPAAFARFEERRITAGLDAGSILIELTESRPVDDLLRLRRTVERVRDVGYRIALDDITPSVPHLESLIDMPFTDLKLDKAVIQAAPHWPEAVRFIARLAARARPRALSLTAEGIEDDATWTMMRDLGIHHAQGFLISKPMHAADMQGWLAEWRARREA